MTNNEPQLGTNRYLVSMLNPFRRPLMAGHLKAVWIKTAVVTYVMLFAVCAYDMGGNGFKGIGVALCLSVALFLLLLVKIELLLRLFGIQKNMAARLKQG